MKVYVFQLPAGMAPGNDVAYTGVLFGLDWHQGRSTTSSTADAVSLVRRGAVLVSPAEDLALLQAVINAEDANARAQAAAREVVAERERLPSFRPDRVGGRRGEQRRRQR